MNRVMNSNSKICIKLIAKIVYKIYKMISMENCMLLKVKMTIAFIAFSFITIIFGYSFGAVKAGYGQEVGGLGASIEFFLPNNLSLSAGVGSILANSTLGTNATTAVEISARYYSQPGYRGFWTAIGYGWLGVYRYWNSLGVDTGTLDLLGPFALGGYKFLITESFLQGTGLYLEIGGGIGYATYIKKNSILSIDSLSDELRIFPTAQIAFVIQG